MPTFGLLFKDASLDNVFNESGFSVLDNSLSLAEIQIKPLTLKFQEYRAPDKTSIQQ